MFSLPQCRCGLLLIFVCILDLESWQSSQRAQSGYLGTMKGLNGMSIMKINNDYLFDDYDDDYDDDCY